MREKERERECVCVCVFVSERERERNGRRLIDGGKDARGGDRWGNKWAEC